MKAMECLVFLFLISNPEMSFCFLDVPDSPDTLYTIPI